MAKKRPPRRRSAHLITRSELAPVGIAGAKSAVKPDAPLWLLTAVIRRRGREKRRRRRKARASLYGFRLTDSRQRDSFPESKQLSFVAMNREGANHDDDSRAF
ncbi:MAG: hypothetical protein ABSD90_18400, partial [Methylocystis sp.]